MPVFIFDTTILNKLEDKADARVIFIHDSLQQLKTQLEERGSSLLILMGNPVTIYKDLSPKAVYINHDYEPYARDVMKLWLAILAGKGIIFKSYKDQVILTENTHVHEPFHFVDEQRVGPFALWHHQHHFREVPGGVEMKDEGIMLFLIGWPGRMANRLFVERKVNTIFDYRFQWLEKYVSKKQQSITLQTA